MTNQNTVNLTSPVGRLVWGDLYNPQTKNYDGKPLTNNDGSARVDYPIGVAVPKTAAAWWDEPWGKQIYAVGAQAHPNSYQRPDFSWKIVDGDSMVPNRKNRKPAEQEGHRGNWVLRFSSGFAPNLYTVLGQPVDVAGRPKAIVLAGKDAIIPGYFVQVNFDVAGNGPTAKTPGVYLNHKMVCLIAYGAPIARSLDPDAAGFGASTLPVGASLTPPAAFTPPASPQPPAASAPLVLPVMPPPVPHPTILAGPTPAPPPPAHVMTAKAGPHTYEAMRAGGWTDEALVRDGYMLPG